MEAKEEKRLGRRMSRPARLRLCAFAILLLGLGGAAWVYLNVTGQPAQDTSYVLEGGTAFTSSPFDSRSYRRSLEYFGGKQAVLMTELREGLDAFLHSEALPLLLASLAALGAGWCLYEAERPPGQQ